MADADHSTLPPVDGGAASTAHSCSFTSPWLQLPSTVCNAPGLATGYKAATRGYHLDLDCPKKEELEEFRMVPTVFQMDSRVYQELAEVFRKYPGASQSFLEGSGNFRN